MPGQWGNYPSTPPLHINSSMFFSDEGLTLETIDFTIQSVSAVHQPFSHSDLNKDHRECYYKHVCFEIVLSRLIADISVYIAGGGYSPPGIN